MRCDNCGWENPEGLTKCEKCNAPLSGQVNNNLSATARESGASASPHMLSKTVNENAIFGSEATSKAPLGSVCPKCGYPLREGVKVCPNCHYGSTSRENGASAAPARPVNATEGTVNPWVNVAPTSKCSLEPIAQDGVDTPSVIILKGDKHELNRANLDPENKTITSHTQAILSHKDGQWYIQNMSAQKTTFIQVKGDTALKEGDVILMGNRQFVFHIK